MKSKSLGENKDIPKNNENGKFSNMTPYNPFSGDNSDNCYIATRLYGNKNHPNVKKLRRFRDDVLRGSDFGDAFIKLYYTGLGKYIAEKMDLNSGTTTTLRKVLDFGLSFYK